MPTIRPKGVGMVQILVRKPDEEIVIGQHITIRVIKTSVKDCVLEIDAPSDVPVFRREMVEAMPSLVPRFRHGLAI